MYPRTGVLTHLVDDPTDAMQTRIRQTDKEIWIGMCNFQVLNWKIDF